MIDTTNKAPHNATELSVSVRRSTLPFSQAPDIKRGPSTDISATSASRGTPVGGNGFAPVEIAAAKPRSRIRDRTKFDAQIDAVLGMHEEIRKYLRRSDERHQKTAATVEDMGHRLNALQRDCDALTICFTPLIDEAHRSPRPRDNYPPSYGTRYAPYYRRVDRYAPQGGEGDGRRAVGERRRSNYA
jgi:hypothetical protein